MRQTVEEKLEKTLQTRLQALLRQFPSNWSLSIVVLEKCRQLPVMSELLTRFSLGPRTRGILGELQLGQIIEDIMTPAQYEREYATVENSSERVDVRYQVTWARRPGICLPTD